MKYADLKETYSPDEDKLNSLELGDTRKDHLTLIHLSKLRKIREFRKYQEGIKSQQIKAQYAGSGGESGDMGGGEL